MKDYFDLVQIIKSKKLDSTKLKNAMKHTFDNRKTELTSQLQFSDQDLATLSKMWASYLTKWDLKPGPRDFNDILLLINQYLEK